MVVSQKDEILALLIKDKNNVLAKNTVSMIHPCLKNKAGGKAVVVKCLEELILEEKVIKVIHRTGSVIFKAT